MCGVVSKLVPGAGLRITRLRRSASETSISRPAASSAGLGFLVCPVRGDEL